MKNYSSEPVAAVLVDDRPRRGRLSRLPVLAELGSLVRFFRDGEASVLGKVFVLAAVAYIIFPFDAVPDLAPIVGWLDDLGVAMLATFYLSRVLKRYRQE